MIISLDYVLLGITVGKWPMYILIWSNVWFYNSDDELLAH